MAAAAVSVIPSAPSSRTGVLAVVPPVVASISIGSIGAPAPRDRHPAAVYLAQLAPGSRRTMRGALDTIADLLTGGRDNAETLDWAALRYQHTAAVRAALIDRFAPATANKMLAALRRVLKEAWRLGLMAAEEYHRAADVHGVKGESLQRGRALSVGEMGGLVDSCVAEDSATGARDAALLAVLYGAGLRRAEAVALDLEHYDAETGTLTVRSGKGRKDRIAYAEGGAKLAIEDWIAVRGHAPGPLFVRIRKGGQITRARLSASGVRHVAVTRSASARVAHFSPHDLRRTFISDLLDAGADIVAVQKLAGHANVQTTAKYDRRGERAKRKAAALLHMPYRSRKTVGAGGSPE